MKFIYRLVVVVRKADPQEAVSCLLKAIEIYTDMGRFTIAAKHHITIAEICETDTADIELVSVNTSLHLPHPLTSLTLSLSLSLSL